jgi:hypothetical protein
MAAIEAAMSAAEEGREAETDFRLGIIHRGGSNINRLRGDVNRLRSGVNNLLRAGVNDGLINGNGPINVNRLTFGLNGNTYTETISAIAISRY